MIKDIVQFFIAIFFILLTFLGVGLFMIKTLSSYECQAYGETAGLETRHVGVGTCMVNDTEYGWMSYEERKMARFGERTGDK